jgi:hypothetical protein
MRISVLQTDRLRRQGRPVTFSEGLTYADKSLAVFQCQQDTGLQSCLAAGRFDLSPCGRGDDQPSWAVRFNLAVKPAFCRWATGNGAASADVRRSCWRYVTLPVERHHGKPFNAGKRVRGSMHISLDEAITIHARMGLVRFGSRGAKKRAISTAHRLRRKADDAGVAVWERVAAEIDRADRKRARPIWAGIASPSRNAVNGR